MKQLILNEIIDPSNCIPVNTIAAIRGPVKVTLLADNVF